MFWSIFILALIATVGVFSSLLTGEWNYGRAGVAIFSYRMFFSG
ncbi:hypothetical protein [Rheinheimera sp.]